MRSNVALVISSIQSMNLHILIECGPRQTRGRVWKIVAAVAAQENHHCLDGGMDST